MIARNHSMNGKLLSRFIRELRKENILCWLYLLQEIENYQLFCSWIGPNILEKLNIDTLGAPLRKFWSVPSKVLEYPLKCSQI